MTPPETPIDQRCPHCGAHLTATTNLAPNYVPQPLDASVCVACGGLSVVGADLKLRLPTITELFRMKESPQWAKVKKYQQGLELVRNIKAQQ